MSFSETQRAALLALCDTFFPSLEVADELGAMSVAFPAISTGIYGYPSEAAARIAVTTVQSSPTKVERVLLVAFDAATVGFGFSRTMPLALLFLAGTGLADTVSMTFRHNILQLLTPDALRGRVTAANQVFVQGGPQLGQLEAGVVAAGLGVPFSVIVVWYLVGHAACGH